MEHAQVTRLSNGFYKIIPYEGYILRNKISNTFYVEAVTKNINEFEAVLINDIQ